MLTEEDKTMIITLICQEQSKMIVTDHTQCTLVKYKQLEEIKVKIKSL